MLAELAAAVGAGRIDPVDLVEESLRRIEQTRHLNAVIAVYADEAREAARQHNRKGPLAGLPFLVKDMARVKGHVTTMGSTLYVDAAPDTEDDAVVQRLREAGAIIVGRTNSPEFGGIATTFNSVYGATGNPWNPEYTPGGSSGGSGSALASGIVPLVTTSDGGGSTRCPSSLSGLLGYKPTMGAIGRNLLPRWIDFSTQGITAASVADLMTQVSVFLGMARGDTHSFPTSAIDLEMRTPKKVFACRTFREDIDSDIEENFERTLDVIAGQGIEVVRIDNPSRPEFSLGWYIISTAQLAQSLLDVQDKWDQLTDYIRPQVEFGMRTTTAQYIAAHRMRHEATGIFDDILEPSSCIVVPVTNARAWKADAMMTNSAGKVSNDPAIAMNTTECNFTGHPGMSIPMGVDNNGVPCGLQVIAPRFQDGLAFGLAQVLERAQPWPLVAPGFTQFGLS
jgi:Asp-tRNA(Asn)/Glu-tRNA(Gln) amidotransferase A subunit family amidase